MKVLIILSISTIVSQCRGYVDDGECSAPAILPTAKCSEMRTAWVYNTDSGICVETHVCPSTGPNKYQYQIDCEVMCEGPCSAPAYHPKFACFAVAYTWRYNGQSCEYVTACPNNGANRFPDEQACLDACGGWTDLDKCSAPPILPNVRCIEQTAWVYTDSGKCEETNVCPLSGSNKYLNMQSCIDNCIPEDCISPSYIEPPCYSGEVWRFDATTGKCKNVGVCGLTGQNKFETEASCLNFCTSGGKYENLCSIGSCSFASKINGGTLPFIIIISAKLNVFI